MISLEPGKEVDGGLRILCFGAHSDDIEIGAGATVLGLARRHSDARIAWHVLAGKGAREAEARDSAAFFTHGFARAEVHVHGLDDGSFPAQLRELKCVLEEAKNAFPADIVLTHYRQDLHQDHRTLGEVTWQTFRDHLILEYEILKYDGDLSVPNMYVPVSESMKDQKLKALEQHFASQRGKDWFCAETFSALMRIRGVECRSPSGYAEAFYSRKMVMEFGGHI